MPGGRGTALAAAVCVLLAASVAGQPSEAALEESGIIPDIINAVSSSCAANITLSFSGAPVLDGELLPPPEAAAAPNVTIVSGGDALFTMLTVDPDAPDPANPTRRSILHWLVKNVPAGGSASEGTEVTPWAGPRPPSGTHRYVFLAFEQPGQELLEVADPVAAANNSRASFDVRAFAAQYGLGDPCGVAWFLSQP